MPWLTQWPSQSSSQWSSQWPVDVIRVIGQYAVASFDDWELLCQAGLRQALSYRQALSLVPVHMPHVQDVLQSMPNVVLGGVHTLTLGSCVDPDLARLVVATPMLQELNLGSCARLTNTEALVQLHQLHTLRMQLCVSCSQFQAGLEHLELSGCSMIGGDLSTVHTLKLHGCVISNITHMNQNLQSLDLRNTRWRFRGTPQLGSPFEGWTLDHLHQLTQLRELRLSHCEGLKNSNVDGIAGMQDLHTLCLTGCFNLHDFAFMKQLPNLRTFSAPLEFHWALLQHLNLESLALRSNGERLYMLATQPNLRVLSVRWWSHLIRAPDVSRIMSVILSHLPVLHTLDVSNWSTLQDMPVCTNLRRLIVNDCHALGDAQLQTLANSFPNLELLSMSRTAVTDAGLGMLDPLLNSLQHLDISACSVTDAGLCFLNHMHRLESLNVADCQVTPLLVPASVRLLGLNKPGSMSYDCWNTLRRRGVEVVGGKAFQTKLGFTCPFFYV